MERDCHPAVFSEQRPPLLHPRSSPRQVHNNSFRREFYHRIRSSVVAGFGMGGSLGPNVLITGTPGTGKTCTSQQIAERTGLRHINVGEVVRLKQCHEGRDESFDTFILDEDKLCDEMETQMEEGGNIVDFHSCDFFPEHWFDLVLVLRAETSTLFDRLQARGYSEKKVGENVECEIMQVVLEEAREGYPEEAVHEVPSNSLEELESNVSRVEQWLEAWRHNNAD